MSDTTKFFHLDGDRRSPLSAPEDVKSLLASPDQWKPGHSAAELATSWIGAQDFPPPVRKVLEGCADLHGIRLVEGFFEHKTDLGTRGRASQTDLLVRGATDTGPLVIGVEGKRNESFGPPVPKWLAKGGRRQERLDSLRGVLGLDAETCGKLRYQLIHRTVAALYEAEKDGASQALLLVHSFSPKDHGLAAFKRFAEALGGEIEAAGQVSRPMEKHGIALRLAWVSDPRPK